jgi:hypothetical protein
VRPKAFLWWLTDEMIRTVRDAPSFEGWLRAQEFDGLLTKGEKGQLSEAVHVIVDMLKDGTTTLIEATAKGFGEGLGKSIAKTS